ncbi:hypothetical protein ACWD7M_16450 [Streptomyces griseus]
MRGIVKAATGILPGAYAGWCMSADHLAPVDTETGLLRTHPSMSPLRDICAGSGTRPLEMARPFFQPGRTYRHQHEGTFVVRYVDAPPPGVEVPDEMLGVAFGWLVRAGAGYGDVVGQPLGAYTTADFYGWSEVSG